MGNDRVPVDINRDGSYLRKALRYLRTKTNLLDRRCALPHRFGPLRSLPDDESADRLPRVPGSGRSRIDANRYSCYRGSVHPTRTRQMAGADRWCFRPVFHPWSNSRWLDYRPLYLALGILCQPADWYRRAPGAHLLDATTP